MALEGQRPSRAMPRSGANIFAEAAFVAFLLLVFVGLKPFAIRDVAVLPLDDNGDGAGDVWRQVCYLGIFTAVVFSAWARRGVQIFTSVPPLLAALLLWCLLTAFWAQTPDVVIRRAGLEIVVALSAMLSVQTVGMDRALTLLRCVLGFILVVNFASIALVHQAVHLPNESDPQLIGDWRGLYFHKNIAGAVTALAAILFLFRALETRRLAHWAVFAAAAGFTMMTHSKTSLGLLPVALLAGVLFRFARRHSVERWIIAVTGGCVLAAASLLAIVDFNSIVRLFTDPTEFTGRVAIWSAEIGFIRDHPLLGAGFGSFADTGALSPLYNYVADQWVQGEAHGHNAYLQLALTVGGIGFALAMLALVIQPAIRFLRIEGRSDIVRFAPLFAVFVFIVLHNFVESDFLEGDGPAWVAFLLMLGCLQVRERPEQSIAAAAMPAWSAP